MQEVLDKFDPFFPSNIGDCDLNTIENMFNKQKKKSTGYVDMSGVNAVGCIKSKRDIDFNAKMDDVDQLINRKQVFIEEEVAEADDSSQSDVDTDLINEGDLAFLKQSQYDRNELKKFFT